MKFSLASILAMFLTALLVAVVSPHSVFVFFWWAVLMVAAHRLMFGTRDLSSALLVYVFYGFLALVMYQTQLWTNPSYYGFSGGFGVGTDDSYFCA